MSANCIIKFHKPGHPKSEVPVHPAVARASAYSGHYILIAYPTFEKAKDAVEENMTGLVAVNAKQKRSHDPRVWAFPNGSTVIFGNVDDDNVHVYRGMELSAVYYEGTYVPELQARVRRRVNETRGVM